MECLACKANQGIARISPGVQIYASEYWLVEHAYPSALPGWLVIVLKRHCEAFHKLEAAEFADLAAVQTRVIDAMHGYFQSRKEYIFCFSEGPGFKHLHFHVVPLTDDLDPQYKGAKVFHYLKRPESEWVPRERVQEICLDLREMMGANPS